MKKKVTLKGYGALFDKFSVDLGGGLREKIAKGAFAKSIGEDDIRMLWNHDSNYILARNKSGTLKLWEDAKGLGFEGKLPKATWAADLAESIRRGDVSQTSFGFQIVREAWERRSGEVVRILEEVKLFDVSPVVFPAYPQTMVYVEGMDDVFDD